MSGRTHSPRGGRRTASRVERSTRVPPWSRNRWPTSEQRSWAATCSAATRALDAAQPWNGWWGVDPPFHHPVFVLTHHARPPLALQGGTTFRFVTEGIAAALELARQVARGPDVSLAGGASTARQYLGAGLVDEMEIHLVPILLGGGERLFEGVRDLGGLHLVRTVAAPNVTHLKFVRR